MPDFDRVARFKHRTHDAEGVWVAAELEKAWTYGCAAVVTTGDPKPLKKGTGKITGVDRNAYMRDYMRKQRAADKAGKPK